MNHNESETPLMIFCVTNDEMVRYPNGQKKKEIVRTKFN